MFGAVTANTNSNLTADTGLSSTTYPNFIIQGVSNSFPSTLAIQSVYPSNSGTKWFTGLTVRAISANSTETTFTVTYYTPT
jgi:hypothetical protein